MPQLLGASLSIRRRFLAGVNGACADEVLEVCRQVAHGPAETQEPWSLSTVTPRAQRGD
jgi:hypothetical protein